MSVSGTCLCGAVRWSADGAVNSVSHCHCSMCRKHHGSAFATFAGSPLEGFRWLHGEDQIRHWRASELLGRTFCGTCGASGPVMAAEQGLAEWPAGSVTGALGIRPRRHIFVGSKAPWYEITDTSSRFRPIPGATGWTGRPWRPSRA